MFDSYEAVSSFIDEFENCRLPKAHWTHEAHLVAGFWYLSRHPPQAALDQIRRYIKRHNESVGTANTDHSGYHETITRLYLTGIAQHMQQHTGTSFSELLPSLLASPLADSTWPLRYYSSARLFSVEARHRWMEPDLQPFP